jgi:ABC-2 type transport system permease protein
MSATAITPPPARSRLYWAASDSLTLIGRSVRMSARSIDAVITAAALPVMLLLLFVYVFGGAIRVSGRYIDYVVPGIILLCAGFGSATTAVSVCQDMTSGSVDRFRSLPIVSSALLTGHVVASILRNLASTAIVIGVALLIGFHPHAGVPEWLATLGILVLFMTAISWLAACFGLIARSAEAANAFTFVVMFLPYVSSAFVPTGTMPAPLRAFAAHQPVTPIIETLRGLLIGPYTGGHAVVALAWCIGAAIGGSAVATFLFRRRTAR